MGYEASLESTLATFDSPSMSENEMGIVLQYNTGGSVGVPTWDGDAMTEAIQNAIGGVAVGIWYITGPTAGVTTIARGAASEYCIAIRASDLAWGTIVGDTDNAGGGGQGGLTMSLDGVLPQDLLVAVAAADDSIIGFNYIGVGSEKQAEDFGDDIGQGITAEGQSGDAVDMSWSFGTSEDAGGACCVFKGRGKPGKGNVIFLG